ncbi:MAG: sigma-54 dependent transcriptional regulator [Methylococcales bacterium]
MEVIEILKSTVSPSKALIVDDEPDICELAEITLNRMNIDTRSANDLQTARHLLETEKFDICITDMNLPDGNGIELVEHVQKTYPDLPIAVITAYGSMDSAVRALKAGAFDFVSKPIDLHIFRDLINSAIKLTRTPDKKSAHSGNEVRLLGHSKPMNELRDKISRLARSQAPVFIHGESGSGKEVAARLIHQKSARADKPFIAVNCGAIPAELMESEFFGHKKGSFTGASSDKEGLFKAADKGTLFLDEIADLPIQMQVKLLRSIQEKSIRPIGEHEEQAVDIRILSASHKNLMQLVELNKFREDLFYRINVIDLNVPPLRERQEDIAELAAYLLERISNKSDLNNVSLTEDALSSLCQYHFPGNVRELENILERAIALTDSNQIDASNLQFPQTKNTVENDTVAPSSQTKNNEHRNLHLVDQEIETIKQALEKSRWNKTAAALLLGLTPRQLSYRIKKLNIK